MSLIRSLSWKADLGVVCFLLQHAGLGRTRYAADREAMVTRPAAACDLDDAAEIRGARQRDRHSGRDPRRSCLSHPYRQGTSLRVPITCDIVASNTAARSPLNPFYDTRQGCNLSRARVSVSQTATLPTCSTVAECQELPLGRRGDGSIARPSGECRYFGGMPVETLFEVRNTTGHEGCDRHRRDVPARVNYGKPGTR